MKAFFSQGRNVPDTHYNNSEHSTGSGTDPIQKQRNDRAANGVSTWKKRHASFIKCVSVLVIALFLNQQIGWAQGGQPVWAQARPADSTYAKPIDLNGIKVPNDVAKTQEAFTSGDDVVIHIQDAHSSLAAQYSIANLLDSLVTNYDLSLIALEGAEG
ncbi:MAG: hypothetical protein GF392_02460, partial [Candidatus Omnitrophica bacterium]|nr:hypothetical protein [Candidatus Omnitrophota bacterium]